MMPANSKLNMISEGESSVVDIISNLPDFVLAHILSFLPTTEEAVATSILSKRWRYVWTSVDKLIFDNTRFDYSRRLVYTKKHYDRFVYKVLKLHQGNIKSFTLSGHQRGCDESDVISWINTAISRGVERLHVGMYFTKMIPQWPLSIFNCKTLVDLKMWGLCNVSMDIPSTPIFPCLKKLQVMPCDNGFFKGVVSQCLALEHFMGSVDGNPVDIVSSSMKRLDLHAGAMRHIDPKIVLCVPSLQYLYLYCAMPSEFIVEEQLSSLIEATIYFYDCHSHSRYGNAKEVRDSFVRFIQPMSNVKSLRIRSSCSTFFNSVRHGQFVNLTKLDIISTFFEWSLLLSFMESSIKLEAITLKKASTLTKPKLAWKEPKKVPTSLSSSLRKISIHGYGEEELPVVKYVLRTAQILERMDIHCAIRYRDNDDWKSDMLRNLQKFHRACEICEIVLV